jgi:hypothetical protein
MYDKLKSEGKGQAFLEAIDLNKSLMTDWRRLKGQDRLTDQGQPFDPSDLEFDFPLTGAGQDASGSGSALPQAREEALAEGAASGAFRPIHTGRQRFAHYTEYKRRSQVHGQAAEYLRAENLTRYQIQEWGKAIAAGRLTKDGYSSLGSVRRHFTPEYRRWAVTTYNELKSQSKEKAAAWMEAANLDHSLLTTWRRLLDQSPATGREPPSDPDDLGFHVSPPPSGAGQGASGSGSSSLPDQPPGSTDQHGPQ